MVATVAAVAVAGAKRKRETVDGAALCESDAEGRCLAPACVELVDPGRCSPSPEAAPLDRHLQLPTSAPVVAVDCAHGVESICVDVARDGCGPADVAIPAFDVRAQWAALADLFQLVSSRLGALCCEQQLHVSPPPPLPPLAAVDHPGALVGFTSSSPVVTWQTLLRFGVEPAKDAVKVLETGACGLSARNDDEGAMASISALLDKWAASGRQWPSAGSLGAAGHAGHGEDASARGGANDGATRSLRSASRVGLSALPSGALPAGETRTRTRAVHAVRR